MDENNELEEVVVPEEQDTPAEKKKPDLRILFWLIGAALLAGLVILLVSFLGGDSLTYPVRINEVLASNTRYPNSEGRCCDYIELHNTADHSVDLGGFQLGDMEGAGRYVIPTGTVLPAGGYLVVYCDPLAEGYAPFGISRAGGEIFYLIGTNGAIVDQLTTLPTDLDQAMVFDGEKWTVSAKPTPGAANAVTSEGGQGVYNSAVSPVCISEFSAANTGFLASRQLMCDWVELHNTGSTAADISGYSLSDNVGNDKYIFPEGTVIPADGYLLVYCADGLEEEGVAPFGLSKLGGETVVLKNEGSRIVEIADSLPMEKGSQTRDEAGLWLPCDRSTPGYPNTEEGYSAFLAAIGAKEGMVVISELMSADQLMLPDAWGDFSDWAELYNTGAEPVQLDGWFLSDDPENPMKWQFPKVELGAGQRLIVYLSGRDTVKDGQVHAGFSLSAGGESLILSSYVGSKVDGVTFGASDANTSFVCANGEAILTTTPTPGFPNDDAGYESFCSAQNSKGALAIWEVMTENDWFLPQSLGLCYDWVELKNISDETIEMSDYYITDDPDVPQMFRLPAGELKPGELVVIVLSGDVTLSNKKYDHGNFALDAKEDTLLVYGKDSRLLDFVFLTGIPVQHSYGRLEGKGGFHFMKPTPDDPNKDGFRQISAEPVADIAAGVHVCDKAVSVKLEAEGTIYYTLDGSDPDAQSHVYEGPLEISDTKVLRAAAIEDGKMISGSYTATFVFQTDHTLPVVSLVTDPDNLWSRTGIYKDDNELIKEEKRPGNISYSGEDGSFSMDCRINMHGATTLMWFPKKSFTVSFRDAYDGILNYDVFGDGEVTHFSKLILRNAYEGGLSTYMRDTMMADLADSCSESVVNQKYRYITLYLNGEFWGIYAFRELHSAEHYGSYFDVPSDTVTKQNYTTDIRNSSIGQMWRWLEKNDFKSEEDYAYAKSLLDIDSFVDWIIFQAYTGNFDINGNMRYYYSTADGVWRCALTDVDLGFFRAAAFKGVAESFHHGRLMGSLMENEEFRGLMNERLSQLAKTTFSNENVLATIDKIAAIIRPEIPKDAERWEYKISKWEREVQDLKDFCDGRIEYIVKDWCSLADLTKAEQEQYFGDILN